MKRGQRPSRHIRRLRTKHGRKARLINPNIKRKRTGFWKKLGLYKTTESYGHATGVDSDIESKRLSAELAEKNERQKEELERIFTNKKIEKDYPSYPKDQRPIGEEIMRQKLLQADEALLKGEMKKAEQYKEEAELIEKRNNEYYNSQKDQLKKIGEELAEIEKQRKSEEEEISISLKTQREYERIKQELDHNVKLLQIISGTGKSGDDTLDPSSSKDKKIIKEKLSKKQEELQKNEKFYSTILENFKKQRGDSTHHVRPLLDNLERRYANLKDMTKKQIDDTDMVKGLLRTHMTGEEKEAAIKTLIEQRRLMEKANKFYLVAKNNKNISNEDKSVAKSFLETFSNLKEKLRLGDGRLSNEEIAGIKMLAMPKDKMVSREKAAEILGVTEQDLEKWSKFNVSYQKAEKTRSGGLVKKDIPLLLPNANGEYSLSSLNVYKRGRTLFKLNNLENEKDRLNHAIGIVQGNIKSTKHLGDEMRQRLQAEQVENMKQNIKSKLPGLQSIRNIKRKEKVRLSRAQRIFKEFDKDDDE